MKRRQFGRLLGLVRRIEVVCLRPGDVLIVSTNRALTERQFTEGREQLNAAFRGYEKVFLPPGWSIDVHRPPRDDPELRMTPGHLEVP